MKRVVNILTCVFVLAVTTAAAGQEIRLRAKAPRPTGALRLRDVARLRGLDAALGEIIVLANPTAAADQAVTIEQVQAAVRRSGVNVVPIAFGGAARCRFEDVRFASADPVAPAAPPSRGPSRPGADIAKAPVARTLGDRIRRQLLEEPGAAQGAVELEFTPFSQTVAALEVDRVVAVSSKDTRRLGRRRWRVDYVRDGQNYTRYLTGRVSRRRTVVVALRPLAAGETLRAEHVERIERPDDGSGGWMTEIGDVVGQKARRSIATGQAIRSSDLRAPVLVRRGRTVTVRCGAVQLPARALDSGGRGDRVEFENPRSKRRFWAVVTGPAAAATLPAP